jgi:arylsulfatase
VEALCRLLHSTWLLAGALAVLPMSLQAAVDRRPNVIVILADDVGYSDLGCYGGEIETPHLDALAAGGVRFTQFYNTSRCCPTRASLLTGLYPHQAGIGAMINDRGVEGYRGELNDRCTTMAEVLRAAGYATYMVGKWHVTWKVRPDGTADRKNWPLQRGFDRFYGTLHGAGSYFDPATLARGNTLISPFADPEYSNEEYYYTDAISDQAVRYVKEHARDNQERPFFLYLAYTAGHWPLHAKPADLAKYRGRYDAGYDAIRAGRVEKMRRLGLIDPRWQIAPREGMPWDEVENRTFEARCMEVYAAMLDCMDQGIGRLVAELKRTGQDENTLILFLQDNGGCDEVVGRSGEFVARAARPTLPPQAPGEIQLETTPKQTRDGFPVRQGQGALPGPADTFVAYGEKWAAVSNTPFRGFKKWAHEGGISTPLIAHWPAGIPAARRNALEPQPGHLVDIMPTCLDVAGATYPAARDGTRVHPLEGMSLRPAFAGRPLARAEPLCFEHLGNRALREGRWKLVAKEPAGAWELYDMNADRTEMNNLAAAQPGRVDEMAAKWEAWGRRAQVLPWIWRPAYGARSAVAVPPRRAGK